MESTVESAALGGRCGIRHRSETHAVRRGGPRGRPAEGAGTGACPYVDMGGRVLQYTPTMADHVEPCRQYLSPKYHVL